MLSAGGARNAARRTLDEAQFYKLALKLRRYDVVIVVLQLPLAFMREHLRERELRRLLPNTPIVLYQVVYLATRGPYARWLLEGDASRGIVGGVSQGLERYDWYLGRLDRE